MGALIGEPITTAVYSVDDLSSYEWIYVKIDTSDYAENKKYVQLCGAGEVPMGVICKGEIAQAPMRMIPLTNQPTKAIASAAIAVDATCEMAANGQVVTTTSDGDRIFFIPLEAATAANDIITGYTCNFYRGA